MNLIEKLKQRAIQNKKTIVLPEGEEDRTIVAVSKVLEENIASIIMIGDERVIKEKALKLNANINNALIINPINSDKKGFYAEQLYEIRKNKGMTIEEAKELILDNVYYATMMVKLNEADGMVSGAFHTTAQTLRPALQIIKGAPNVSLISSFFIMQTPIKEFGEDGLLLFADCSINVNPNANELATIAMQTASTAKHLCEMEPKVALLSFSTKGSAEDKTIDIVREALKIVQATNSNINIDGELQLDAAIIPDVALKKAPQSKVAGHANVLIFPNLDAGNIGYKLVERFGKAQAIGPICQGFAKPINDLSRGCSADDIVGAIIVTAVQAQTNM